MCMRREGAGQARRRFQAGENSPDIDSENHPFSGKCRPPPSPGLHLLLRKMVPASQVVLRAKVLFLNVPKTVPLFWTGSCALASGGHRAAVRSPRRNPGQTCLPPQPCCPRRGPGFSAIALGLLRASKRQKCIARALSSPRKETRAFLFCMHLPQSLSVFRLLSHPLAPTGGAGVCSNVTVR